MRHILGTCYAYFLFSNAPQALHIINEHCTQSQSQLSALARNCCHALLCQQNIELNGRIWNYEKMVLNLHVQNFFDVTTKCGCCMLHDARCTLHVVCVWCMLHAISASFSCGKLNCTRANACGMWHEACGMWGMHPIINYVCA